MKIDFGDLFLDVDTGLVYQLVHGFKIKSKYAIKYIGRMEKEDSGYYWWSKSNTYPISKKELLGSINYRKMNETEIAKFLLIGEYE